MRYRHCFRGLAVLLFALSCFPIEAAEPSAAQLEKQAQALYQEGRYQEGIDPAQRALKIYEKEQGPEHPGTAQSLETLANLYRATGAYAKAEPLLQRALAIDDKVFGREHLATAATLNDLAELYRTKGAYAKAEPLLQRALAIDERAPDPEREDTATTLNNLANLYQNTGAYAKAEPLRLRALRIYERIDGPEHPNVATALNNLAELDRATGTFAKAVPLLQRALSINEKKFGPISPITATSLSNLGDLYALTAEYTKAEALFERALAIREKALGPEHPATAGSLSALARLYEDIAEYDKAEPLYKRALTIREKALGPEHPATAGSLSTLAGLYEETGAYGKAEPLYERALAIREKALGPEHPATATSLNSLGGLYFLAAEYAKAETLYQHALAVREKVLGPEHPGTAVVLGGLAELYVETGAFLKAEPLYQRALLITEKSWGADHPNTAAVLDGLAQLYFKTEAYSKAEPLFQRALLIREKALGPEHPYTAGSLQNLAVLYQATGAYAKAEPLLKRALTIAEKTLGLQHPDTAVAVSNLARMYVHAGANAKAEELFLRALAIRETVLGAEHPDTAVTLNSLANLYLDTGTYAKAESLFGRAQNIEEKNTLRFLLSSSEPRQRDYLLLRAASTYDRVSLSLADHTAQSTALALTGVLQYKGRVLDATSGSATRLRLSLASRDRALLDQLSAVAQQQSTFIYSPPPRLSSEFRREHLANLNQRQEKLQAELSSRNTEYQRFLAPITLASVRERLPAASLLVEFLRYKPLDPKTNHSAEPRYVAFVLKRSDDPAAVDLGPAKPIEDLVKELIGALSDPKNTTYAEVARDISEKLVKPLRPYLAQGERLLLSPDAELNLVPFAALVDEHGDYLGQHYEISYLTSGRDLMRIGAESRSRTKAVVLADPNYGQPARSTLVTDNTTVDAPRSADLDNSGLVFKPLPGTAAEAKALQSLLRLDEQSVLTGSRATEAHLKALHGPRILHLATHAFFLSDQHLAAVIEPGGFNRSEAPLPLEENPLLRSGLALAGANARHSGKSDDGILTAQEAAQLDLVGTQLAVLSACQTGAGKVQTGEGVYGLRRALVLAGAQSQVVSLWKVSDNATLELMVDYYQHLLKGEGRAAALRSVQQQMMKDPAHQHPYYWASFIPIGDWRPLAQEPPEKTH